MLRPVNRYAYLKTIEEKKNEVVKIDILRLFYIGVSVFSDSSTSYDPINLPLMLFSTICHDYYRVLMIALRY